VTPLVPPARSSFHLSRQIAVVGALALSTILSVGLVFLRMIHTHTPSHIFLVWNLFLAWIPMIMALAVYNSHKKQSRLNWLVMVGCALAWLVFMPNAPYIVTDIVNLHPQSSMPFWYDVILFAAFEWTGVFLGLVSLFLMQEIVRKTAGRVAGWLFALGVLALSSFGIYLGRFLRWNSWDVIANPGELLGEIAATIRHPIAHFETYVFSALFSFFIICTYLMLTAMMNFRQETP
jgi:uncharacterized membrane protein